MIAVIPFHSADHRAVLDLLHWIQLLGGCPRQSCLLVADADVQWGQALDILDLANKVFRSATIITNDRPIKDWIEGSNSLFLAAALHIEEGAKEPWLWMEPDCVPLKSGWLDRIQFVYGQANKPFMGQLYRFENPANGQSPFTVLSGIAVYPPDAWSKLAKAMKFAPNLALDVATAPVTVPLAVHTNLIHHFYGELNLPPTFAESKSDKSPRNTWTLDQIKPEAMLFHRNKDGTLMKLLHQRILQSERRADFVSLRRNGDIINVLPMLYALSKERNRAMRLVVAKEFMPLLDGVSYVEAVSWNGDWEDPLGAAKHFNAVNLQVFGKNIQTNMKGDNFAKLAWRKGGVHWSRHWPTIFDRRNPEREQHLANTVFHSERPKLLIKLNGTSSPCGESGFVREKVKELSELVEVVNLDAVHAERIFDLIGLMDRASCLISVDTSTLWLARASKVPVIALTNNTDWGATPPGGNTLLRVPYRNIPIMWPEICRIVNSTLPRPENDSMALVYDSFTPSDSNSQRRIKEAISTWPLLGARPICFGEQGHRSSKSIGDLSPHPFVRDMIASAFSGNEDIAVITNGDIKFSSALPNSIKRSCKLVGCWWAYRCEAPGKPTDEGADVFAFTRSWWSMHQHLFPDFLMGYCWWDDIMVRMMRWSGCPERERVYFHEPHRGIRDQAATAGSRHNERLALAWLTEHHEERQKP